MSGERGTLTRRRRAVVGLAWGGLALAVAGGTVGMAKPAQPGRAAEVAAATVRFGSVDVYVDSGIEELGAYQVEITAAIEGGAVRLVGVEGGEAGAAAFSEPPVYDPAALMQDRVVLAAYTAGDAAGLPTGRVRVARLHVQIEVGVARGDGEGSGKQVVEPTYRVRVIAAGRADGTRIEAAFEAMPGAQR